MLQQLAPVVPTGFLPPLDTPQGSSAYLFSTPPCGGIIDFGHINAIGAIRGHNVRSIFTELLPMRVRSSPAIGED